MRKCSEQTRRGKLLKKNIALITVILVVSAALLGGCGSQNKKEITVMWWGDVYNYGFAEKLVDAYNATNPTKPAKLMGIQGQYQYKLLAMAASKTLPDVVLVTTPNVYDMGSRGALLPLNKRTETAEFEAMKSEMWPNLVEAFNVGGKQLAVPIWTWTPGIYYNKDLFDRAGVSYPSKNWTFKEFEEKSRKLVKRENGKVSIYAYNSTFSLNDPLLLSYLYAHGGAFYTEDYRQCLIDSPASIAALKAFSDLRLKDHIAPKAAEEQGMGTSGRNTDFFQAETVAMRVAGRDYLDVLRQRGGIKFRWGAASMPRGDKPCFFQVAAALAVSAHTRSPEDAWNFISFVAGKKGQKMITTDRSDVTIYRELTYGQDFLGYQDRPDVSSVFRDMLLEAVPSPYHLGDDEWKSRAANHLSLMELGQISTEEACARIAADYKP
jgi:multiple sugar transport system substrate-binding protein